MTHPLFLLLRDGQHSDLVNLLEHPSWSILKDYWDPANEVTPEELAPKSHHIVRWLCTNGHSFRRSPAGMTGRRKTICAACSAIPYTQPSLLEEWDYDKNEQSVYSVGSGYGRVWWLCKAGHSYLMAVHNRVKGQQCPVCSGRTVVAGVNDLQTHFPSLAPLLNSASASSVYFNSSKRYEWLLPCNHLQTATIAAMVKSSECVFCSGRRFLRGFNSLCETHPEMLSEWSDKNELAPSEVFWRSNKLAYWTCRDCGYERQVRISRRVTQTTSCAACAGNVVQVGLNDLTTVAPDLLKFFDYEKNTLAPSQLPKSKSIWWRCSSGHSYQTNAASKMKGFGHCPLCWVRSAPENEIASFVQTLVGSGVLVQRNKRSVIAPLELDVYVPSLQKAIEFNGEYWHSDKVIRASRGISAQDYHRQKAHLCRDAGIELLTVWESRWRSNRQGSLASVQDFLTSPRGWGVVYV